MPFQRPTRPLSVLAGALAAAGLMLAAAGCSNITPLGPEPAPTSLPPAHDLGSPIIMQIMRSQPPTPAGECPVGSVALFGSEPNVPRVARVRSVTVPIRGGTATLPTLPTPTAPPAPGVGVACYLPVGRPVTVTSAAVSTVTSRQTSPASYAFVVAFPAADVAALTAAIRQAYDSGDALGMSVAGKLWQAPQTRSRITALRAEQINLLSRKQALQLYRLLVPSG
jgi:hypothetical protein